MGDNKKRTRLIGKTEGQFPISWAVLFLLNMKIVSRIKPRMYCDSSLIWWDFNKMESGWMFTLVFWIFFGLFEIKIFKNFKIRVFFTRV